MFIPNWSRKLTYPGIWLVVIQKLVFEFLKQNHEKINQLHRIYDGHQVLSNMELEQETPYDKSKIEFELPLST